MNLSAAQPAAVAAGPHVFWLASRAAGSLALVLSSLSVCVGLLMGQRLVRRRGGDLRVVHEALSLATIAALLVHGLALLGDSYMHPSLADISIPLVSSYRTLWTSSGIVAFWVLAALGLSYYARARIGVARWRALHRFTAVAWLLGLAHSLGEGSDSGATWFIAMTALVAVPALILLAGRVIGSAGAADAPPGTSQPAVSQP
jgi:sulfoxide reductase heme-binding subunit YedZ